jgi:DNA polymerase I-like protein with 3'-5' exonuclease and polymerase domains
MITDFATIDFETYYDKEFSLSKMQTDAYCLDDRFEIIGVGLKRGKNYDAEWFSGTLDETREFLASAVDWSGAVCCHNTHFDGFICTQVLGLKPKMWLDTVGMARMRYPYWRRYSLKNVAKALGVGVKGTEVHNFIGYRRADFTSHELAQYANYCMNDAALTNTIGRILLEDMPPLEIYIQDMSIRMFTEPRLLGDTNRLVEYHEDELRYKEELIAKASVDKSELMSNLKFAELLYKAGVIPPKKISKTTGKETYAFAKSDKSFQALLECGIPEVEALVAARIGAKSTISETRALRLIQASNRGALPVHLNYWGAKTTGRFSGGNKMNWQNIPARGRGAEIRKCVIAPKGHKIVVGDSSNIELRVAMVCAGQEDAVQKLINGDDLYCDFASKMYGREITKEDKKERMLGKVAMLSLQYGSGAKTFKEMVRVMAQQDLSEDDAQRIVDLYRYVHSEVSGLWRHCENVVLPAIQNKNGLTPVDRNAWVLTHGEGYAIPGLPGVCYHDLQIGRDGSWQYLMNDKPVNIYGGKVVENLCQHVARHIVMWQTARVHRRYPVSLSVHDEIVCVVPEDQAEDCKQFMLESLSAAPSWCSGEIPLLGEVEIGDSYGDCK